MNVGCACLTVKVLAKSPMHSKLLWLQDNPLGLRAVINWHHCSFRDRLAIFRLVWLVKLDQLGVDCGGDGVIQVRQQSNMLV